MKKPKPLAPSGPMAPIVKPVSTKPSDRPSRMASNNERIPGIPKIPAVVAKKIQAIPKIKTRRPTTGMK